MEPSANLEVRAAFPECPACDEPVDFSNLALNEQTTCPHCDQTHRVDLFGAGGGAAVAEGLTKRLGYDVPLLAEIPLERDFRAAGDAGTPLVSLDVTRPSSAALWGLAERLGSTPRGLAGLQLGLSPVA